MGKLAGESKSNLKNVFEETERSSSAVIFINEITSNREKTSGLHVELNIESMANGKSSVERSRNYLL